MDASQCFSPGQIRTKDFLVDERSTARSLGGDDEVLGTPVIVYWLEIMASDWIHDVTEHTGRSLGQFVSLQHAASVSQGAAVTIELKVDLVFLNTVRFAVSVTAAEDSHLVARGRHDRAIFKI
jgi:predicted thioesterase